MEYEIIANIRLINKPNENQYFIRTTTIRLKIKGDKLFTFNQLFSVVKEEIVKHKIEDFEYIINLKIQPTEKAECNS